MLDFIRETKFERLGVFTSSKEDGNAPERWQAKSRQGETKPPRPRKEEEAQNSRRNSESFA